MIKKVVNEEFNREPSGPKVKETVPAWLQRVATAITNEQDAITEYDYIIQTKGLPPELIDSFVEIQNDEKDHMLILSKIMSEYSKADFPNNTEELSDIPNP